MHHSIIVADRFLDPFVAADLGIEALGLEYGDAHHTDGADYQGVRKNDFFFPVREISSVMQHPVQIDFSFFKCAVAGQRTMTIHNDVGESHWAGILYLSDPPTPLSGTAFWTNRELDWDHMPVEEEIRSTGIEPDLSFRTKVTEQGRSEGFWTLDSIVGQKFNRFLAYPTCYFHSRYPRDVTGTSAADGRLTWSCFFRLL